MWFEASSLFRGGLGSLKKSWQETGERLFELPLQFMVYIFITYQGGE